MLLWLCPSIATGQTSVGQKVIAQNTPELASKDLLETTRKQCINMPINFKKLEDAFWPMEHATFIHHTFGRQRAHWEACNTHEQKVTWGGGTRLVGRERTFHT